MSRFDWTIARTAATGGLIIIVPGAFLSRLVFNSGPQALAWVFLVVVLIGFGLAGYIAGRLRPDTPMLHGSVSALLAFVVAQVFGIIAALARGDSISWVVIPLTALLAASLGVAGALAADVAHRRTARTRTA